MKWPAFVCLLWCIPLASYCSHFDFNETCRQAYLRAYHADFEGVARLAKQERSDHPQNRAIEYVVSFSRFLETTFNESPKQDEEFLEWVNNKVKLVEDGDEHPFKRFALGEMAMYQALVNIRLDNSISGAWAIRRTYITLEENLKKYPDFPLSKKSLYTVQALLSNIPENYRGIAEFFGYGTDQYKALEELKKLQEHLATDEIYGVFRTEVNIYRGIIMLKLTQKYHEGYKIITDCTEDYKTNPVACFVRGKMALDHKKTNEAIDILSHFAGPDCPILYINYDIATAYFYKLDSKAPLYYSYFLKQTKGPGLIKDTYLKLAWYAYLKNMPEKVSVWLKYIEEHETSVREKDKTAVKEAKEFDKLDPTLLKARIHFDGGFYEYSLSILQKDESRLLEKDYTRIRYYYQTGRLHQDMLNFDDAIAYFDKTVSEDFIEGEYFIPVSYFQMGQIYEDKIPSEDKAVESYKKCLQFDNYPYESSYSYRCKMAIKRLES